MLQCFILFKNFLATQVFYSSHFKKVTSHLTYNYTKMGYNQTIIKKCIFTVYEQSVFPNQARVSWLNSFFSSFAMSSIEAEMASLHSLWSLPCLCCWLTSNSTTNMLDYMLHNHMRRKCGVMVEQ